MKGCSVACGKFEADFSSVRKTEDESCFSVRCLTSSWYKQLSFKTLSVTKLIKCLSLSS